MSALILRMLHISPTNDKAEHSHAERVASQGGGNNISDQRIHDIPLFFTIDKKSHPI